jgi:hypothetical protein
MFDIRLVLCNSAAEAKLDGYLSTAQSRRYPGMEELPEGCYVVAKVPVIRNDYKADDAPAGKIIESINFLGLTINPKNAFAFLRRLFQKRKEH